MFWWIVVAVVVLGSALAWWTSGRSKRAVPRPDRRADALRDEVKRQANLNQVGQPPMG